jgi:TPP-dependent pyruvate/acetoin dehydrogenase alpha subunit
VRLRGVDRDRAEAEPWMKSDAVARVAEQVAPELGARIRAEVEAELADAFRFAEASPFPAPAELTTDVYRSER